MKTKDKIYLFDTTLRDGQQTTGVNFSVSDKMIIAQNLDELGIDYVEGGWPGANPTDNDFFSRKLDFKNTKFTAFGMTRRPGRGAENDPGLNALTNSQASTICIVGKSSSFHVKNALEILNKVYDSTRVVAIDEIQFFSEDVIKVVSKLARRGCRVICAGLDQDYMGNPFGPIPRRRDGFAACRLGPPWP